MKSESEVGKNHLQYSAIKFRPMSLLLASNDTVLISAENGGTVLYQVSSSFLSLLRRHQPGF